MGTRVIVFVVMPVWLVALLTVTFGIGWSGARYDAQPATPPQNMCTTIRLETLDGLVPGWEGPHESEERVAGKREVTSGCMSRTFRDRAATEAEADLNFRLTRFGSSNERSPAEEAADRLAIDRARAAKAKTDDAFPDAPKIGDDTVVRYGEIDNGCQTDLTVRVGADLLRVSYYATPSSCDRTLLSATYVAREVLAAL